MPGKRNRDALTRTFTQKEFDDGLVDEKAKLAIEEAQYTKKIPYCDDRRPVGERVAQCPASTVPTVRFDSDPQLGVSERKTRLAETIDEMDTLGRPCLVEYLRKCVEWALHGTPSPLIDLVVLYALVFELDFPWYSPVTPMVFLVREQHVANPAKDRTRFQIEYGHTTNVTNEAIQFCRGGQSARPPVTQILLTVQIPHMVSQIAISPRLLTPIFIDNSVFVDRGTRNREFLAIPFIYPCELWLCPSPTRPPKARTVITGSMLARHDVFVPDSVLHVTRLSLECLQT
jgi:Zn finger protein HypA/HybF involved in hydrogenase expression